MKRLWFPVGALLGLLLLVVSFPGCGKASRADAEFAPGAFPPTMSDTEYHRLDWTRSDCLACHENGANEAPVMRHVSVPEVAKDAKCRTCHVFVAGSSPRE